MKQIFLVFCLVALVASHTTMTSVIINGETKTNCLRAATGNRDGVYDGFPLMDDSTFKTGILSSNYTCGFMPYAGVAASAKCTVAAGATMAGTYYHGQYGSEDPELDKYIARSHKGPIMVSMAKSETGAGKVWFKIYQQGLMTYDPSNWQNNKYASPDLLLANQGKVSFTIPSDITPGNYLLRFELLALHSATQQSGAQPYVRCVELTVTGGGTSNPGSQHLMEIPSTDYATLTHPGVLFNLYQNTIPNGAYTYPGTQTVYTATTPPPPPPVVATSTSTSSPTKVTSTSSAPPTQATSTSSAPPTQLTSTSASAPPTTPTSASTSSAPPTPGSCTIGAKGCPCTTGGACDAGLSCVDKVCLKGSETSTAAGFAASFSLIAAAGAAVCLATL